ncbi:MAG: SpoIIE family protein phosphatase [bacterium]
MFRFAQKEHLIVPAHIDHLASLRDFVTQIGTKYGYSRKLVNAFKIAIDEAATNIINHAYSENEGYITIQAIVRRKSLTINLIDQGAFFDPKWARTPNIKETAGLGEKVGLGIFMMRKLMDEIDYRKSEAGNELSLTKVDRGHPKRLSLTYLWGLPPASKIRYFVNAILLVTLFNVAGVGYYYWQAEKRVSDVFIQSGRKLCKQVGNQISAIKPGLLNGPDGESYLSAILLPIYEENFGQIYSLSVEDSLGHIAWSTVEAELDSPFVRPGQVADFVPGVTTYVLNDSVAVYEFERRLNFENEPAAYKKVHILLSKHYVDNEVHLRRLRYIKLGLVTLGASYVLLALFSFIINYPVRKLSEWVRATGKGEVRKDLDIDGSSEIGEIARAFSDITQRFNETQKHLEQSERFEKEIHLAKDIQQSLLPAQIPVLDKIEIAAYYEGAATVSGDYYDFIEVDQDRLGVVIADVAGKGVPGSMVMTMIRTALRTEARGVHDAAEVLTRVNDFVANDLRNGMFVTVFYLVVNTKTCVVNFASGGHTPLILHRGETGKTFYLNPIGCPVGITLPEKDFFRNNIVSETIQLQDGDTILLYTDGITEARNPQRGEFGEERLLKQVRRHSKLPLTLFVEKLKNSIYSFREDGPLHDDITIVTIRKKTDAEPEGQAEPVPVEEGLSVESKYLSIEDTTKMLDVVAHHPEFAPAEIAAELELPRYKETKINAEKIEAELQRQKLPTPELRRRYAKLCAEKQRNANPPGTPQLSLNGHIKIRKRLRVAPLTSDQPAIRKGDKPAEPGAPTGQKSQSSEPSFEQDRSDTAFFCPDIEADFVFGDFLDQLISSTNREELTETHRPDETLSLDQTEVAADVAGGAEVEETDVPGAAQDLNARMDDPLETDRKALHLPAGTELTGDAGGDESSTLLAEDISDSLIDSIFDSYARNLASPPATVESAPAETTESPVDDSPDSVEMAEDVVPATAKEAPAEPERPAEIEDKSDDVSSEVETAEAPEPPEPSLPATPATPDDVDVLEATAEDGEKEAATEPDDKSEAAVHAPAGQEPEPLPPAAPETPDDVDVLEAAAEDGEKEAAAEPDDKSEATVHAPAGREPEALLPAAPATPDEVDVLEAAAEDGGKEAAAEPDDKSEAAVQPLAGQEREAGEVAEREPEAQSHVESEEPEAPEHAILSSDAAGEIHPAEPEICDTAPPPDLTQESTPELPVDTEQELQVEPEVPDNLASADADESGTDEQEAAIIESGQETLESDVQPPQAESEGTAKTDDLELAREQGVGLPGAPAEFEIAEIEPFASQPGAAEPESRSTDEATRPVHAEDGPEPAETVPPPEQIDQQAGLPGPVPSEGTLLGSTHPIQPDDIIEFYSGMEAATGELIGDAGSAAEGSFETKQGQEPGAAEDSATRPEGPAEGADGSAAGASETTQDDADKPESSHAGPPMPDALTETEANTDLSDSDSGAETREHEGYFDTTVEALLGQNEPETDFPDEETKEVESEIQVRPDFIDNEGDTPAAEQQDSEIALENKNIHDISPEKEAVEFLAREDTVDAPEMASPDLTAPEETKETPRKPPDTPVFPSLKGFEITSNELDDKLATRSHAPEPSLSIEPQSEHVGDIDAEQRTSTPHGEVAAGSQTPPVQRRATPTYADDRPPAEQPPAELSRGTQHYQDKQYEDAIICFKAAIKRDPDFTDGYVMLGNAYFRNQMYEDALTAYRHIEAFKRSDPSFRENLGLIYWKLGQKHRAAQEWRAVLRQQPGRKDLARRIHALQASRNAARVGRETHPEPAPPAPRPENRLEGSTANGDTRTFRLVQAGIDQYRNNDYESAIQTFRQVVKQFPDQKEAYNLLGNAYFRNNMLPEAIEIYERLAKLDADSTTTLENLGFIHFKQGAYDRAVAQWRKILQKNPQRHDLKRKIEKVSQLM